MTTLINRKGERMFRMIRAALIAAIAVVSISVLPNASAQTTRRSGAGFGKVADRCVACFLE